VTGPPVEERSDLPTVTYLSMDPLTSTVGSSQVRAYVECLALRGVDVDLVTFEHDVDPVLHSRLVSFGVTWRPQRFGQHGAVGGLSRVLRAAWAVRGAAIVHARSDMAAAAVMLARIDHWVWDVRSFWADQKVAIGVLRFGSPQERVFRWVERRSAFRATAVITLTGSAIEELDRRYGGVVGKKARIVTTCVDLGRFRASPMPMPMPMPIEVRVLLAGTLNRYYDLGSMLDLVAELRRRRPVEFIVASPEGSSWEDELVEVDVKRMSATPEEMPDLVASCHVGLSICRDDAGASLLAAMPTKIGEFLASGRPVIVNPGLVDAAELVGSHGCGVVFGASVSGRIEEAANLLERQLDDPYLPDRCRNLAEAHFDLEDGVDQLVATYHSVKASP